jgi:type I restriction enzyme M protein
MFEQTFKNIDDVLRKEAGCTTELDYTEQSSWLLFLKYLAGLEEDKATEAALDGKKYAYILDKPYRWETWAAPKDKDGKLDHNAALTGDDLRDFVNGKLFPYLHGFKQRATGPDTIEYKIGEIFGEIKNKIQSGYNLREIIDHIDELRFRSQTEKHELSHLYEAKIKNMGNAGRNGGEYYTPRPLIRAIIQVVQPKIGDKIYDGACGSAGFLCESFVYLTSKGKLTTKDLATLQTRTFYGKEKKSLAYVIAIMNMILHGIEAPNIVHTNTLSENLADIQEKDRYDVVLANPPFGGKERPEVQQNFPIRTGETAFLFLQHFIKILKAGGRGGVVIKNTFLSNTDNASVSLRKLLLESCNLHTVLDCPGGTFQGAGVKTVVLFFEKGAPTRKVWFYQLDPGRNLGKTNPLNDDDLAEFVKLQKTFADSPKSWSVDAKTIDQTTFDLSVKNPDGGEEIVHRSPKKIMDERGIAALDRLVSRERGSAMLENIKNFDAAMKVVVSDNKKVKKGSLMICTASGSKSHLGKVAYIDDDYDYAFGGFMGMITPRNGLNSKYLFHLMTSPDYKDFIGALSDGANINNLKFDDLKKFPIPYPKPDEQQRIVGLLDEAFAGIANAVANAEKNLQNARALFDSYHHSIFAKLREGWHERSRNHEPSTLIPR